MCCVNTKTQELIFQTHFVTPLFSSEMPDLKAADEVDFLSNTRASSASAEVTIGVGDPAATPDVKQGLATRAVSGIKSVGAQNVFSLVSCV